MQTTFTIPKEDPLANYSERSVLKKQLRKFDFIKIDFAQIF